MLEAHFDGARLLKTNVILSALTSLVLCILKSDMSTDADDCNASATDWATLILSIIAINVSWWAFEIPVLIKDRSIAKYFRAVCWTCIRICLPSYAFVLVVRDVEFTPAQWSKAFYDGPWSVTASRQGSTLDYERAIDHKPRTLSKFGVAKAVIFDTIGVVAVGLSVSRLWKLDSDQLLEGLNASTWSFPALPVSIFGLWIQIAGTTKLRPRWILIVGFALVSVVGAVITIAMHYSHQPGTEYKAMLLYIPMAVPFAFIFPIGRQFIMLLTYLAVTFSRVGGMTIGGMSDDGNFPFCSIRGPKFAIPYFLFGALASVFAYLSSHHILNAFWAKQSLHGGLGNNREQPVRNPRFNDPQGQTGLLPMNAPAIYVSTRDVPYLVDATGLQPQPANAKPQSYTRVTQIEDQPPYIPSNISQSYARVTQFEDQPAYAPRSTYQPMLGHVYRASAGIEPERLHPRPR